MSRHEPNGPNASRKSAATSEARLRGSGLRKTPVRIGVLEVLTRSARPMSVPQILARLKGVDTVTVYRTLHTFLRKRLVHRVRGEDRSWLYAISPEVSPKPQHLHPHFVCDQCGKVDCLDNTPIPANFVASLEVSRDYDIRWPEVVLHGLCPRCRT